MESTLINFIQSDSPIKLNATFNKSSIVLEIPVEMDAIKGDYSKAKEKLGWKPKTTFEDMIKNMIDNDIKLLKNTK